MNAIQRKVVVRIPHVLVVASLLAGATPVPVQAAPLQGDPIAAAPAPAQNPEPPEPGAEQPASPGEEEPGPPHSVFLPFVARNHYAGPRAEAALDGQAQPWLALPGDVVIYTLALTSTGELAMRDGALVARVPEQVQVVGLGGAVYNTGTREMRWAIGSLEAGQAVTWAFQARVAQGAAKAAVESRATFEAQAVSEGPLPGVTATVTTTLLVGEAISGTLTPEGGELASPDGRVQLVAPSGAVTRTTDVRVADFPLPAWEAGEPVGLALFDVRAVGEAGQSLVDGSGHTCFLQPLTVTADLSDDAHWMMNVYLLHQTDPQRDVWEIAPAEYDRDTQQLTAVLDTFSPHQAVGDYLKDGSFFLFRNWPEASLYNGAAVYAFPIATVAGRNGMGPSVSLSYSSRSVDGIIGNVQSPDVGLGWSIGGEMKIVREIKTFNPQGPAGIRWQYGRELMLIINGASYLLKEGEVQPGGGRRYYTEEHSALLVMRYNPKDGYGDQDPNPSNQSKDYWVVMTPDGTTYRFGFAENSEQMVRMEDYYPGVRCYWHKGDYPPFDCTRDDIRKGRPAGYAGEASGLVPSTYWLDEVKDVHGNAMTYRYHEERRTDTDPNYDRGAHLERIAYPGGCVRFVLESRGVHDNGPLEDNRQIFALWEEQRVHSIQVLGGTCSGEVVREYVLTYETHSEHVPQFKEEHETTLLKEIHQYGRGGESGGQELPVVRLTYRAMRQAEGRNKPDDLDCHRLVRVDNGYGGWVTFRYNKHSDELKNDGVYSYRVEERRQGDGQGREAWLEYEYGPACFADYRCDGQPCACVRDQPRSDTLWGHDWTQETVHGYAGEVLVRTRHYFHNVGSQALGRERRTEVWSPGGQLLQAVENTWVTAEDYEMEDRYRSDLLKTVSCQGSACTGTAYDYDWYGNVVAEYQWGDVAMPEDDRTLRRTYAYNTADWIVGLPIAEALTEDRSGATVARQYFYYDGQAHGLAPTQGDLTRADVWQLGGPYTTTYEYDAWGNTTAVSDALGHRTTTEYDPTHQFPIETCSGVELCSHTEYYGVNASGACIADGYHYGAVCRAYGPNGTDTAIRYAYDGFGRLTRIVRPDDTPEKPTVAYEYHDGDLFWMGAHQREESGKDGTLDIYQFYDGLGRASQARAEAAGGQWTVSSQEYDGLGRVVKGYLPCLEATHLRTAPAGHYAETAYDALGRVVRVTNPDGTYAETRYDGWTTTAIDANRHQRVYTNDGFGQLVRVEEYTGTVGADLALYATTDYGYDALGNLVVVSDTNKVTTTMQYDELGRKVGMHDPDMGDWAYGYDVVGNLIWQEDAKGQRIEFGYDALNRLTWKGIREQGTGIRRLAEYRYDEDGHGYGIGQRTSTAYTSTANLRLALSASPGGSTAYVYDARGRVVMETHAFAGLGEYSTGYTYDALDRVRAMTYPDGEVVAQEYDDGGLPETLASSLGETFVGGTSYDASGQITRLALGNALQTTYDYDEKTLRLNWMKTGPASEPGLHQCLAYGYDDVGNVTRIEDRVLGDTQLFAYDPLDRLVEASATGLADGAYTRAYGYDRTGNIDWRVNEGQYVDYQYNSPAPHAVTDLGDGSHFEYDDNGNMRKRVEISGTQTLTYHQQFDVENRLVVVTATNGITQTVTRFGYDGDGRRVWQATEEGVTLYVGEHYEEFVPGVVFEIGDWGLDAGSRVAEGTEMRESVLSAVERPASGDAQGLSVSGEPGEAEAASAMGTLATITWDSQADFREYAWPQSGIDTTSTPGSIKSLDLNDDFNAGFIDSERWEISTGEFFIDENYALKTNHEYASTIQSSDFYLQGDYVLDILIYVREYVGGGAESHTVYAYTEGGACGQVGVFLQKGGGDLGVLRPHPLSIDGNAYNKTVAIVRLARVGGKYSAWVKNGTYRKIYQDYGYCTDDVRLVMSWQSSKYPDDKLGGRADDLIVSQGRYARPSWWTSGVRDGGAKGYWTSLSFAGDFPSEGGYQSWVQWQMRTGPTGQPDGSWTGWHTFGSVSQNTTWSVPESLRYHRYAQVRAGLVPPAGRMVTPRIDSVSLSVETDTSPPNVYHGCGSGWNPSCSPSASDSGTGVAGGEFYIDGVLRGDLSQAYANVCSTYALADGTHAARVRAWDKVGNQADQTWSNAIRCDRTRPTGSIVINGGATWTNSRDVTLGLPAVDTTPGSGVSKMRVWNDGQSEPVTWEPYATSKSWTLPDQDGTHTVYVRYQDTAGNASIIYDDDIGLDRQPPTGSIVINGGAAWTDSRNVTLILSASDPTPGSGVSKMRVWNDGQSEPTGWEPYAASKPWELRNLDGTRTVYVRYRDAAGNASIIYDDDIGLDRQPPTGSIVINGGAAWTNSLDVTLTLSASDPAPGSGVSKMRVWNDGQSEPTGWEPYATSKPWELRNLDGTRTVYVRYRDTAGNASTVYSDQIGLDRQPPTGSVTINGGAAWTNSRDVTLTLSATDPTPGSGVSKMRVWNDGQSEPTTWEPYATSKPWALRDADGLRTVYVRYRDAAGNASIIYDDDIGLDRQPPTGSILINDGHARTNHRDVTLTLSASDTGGSGNIEMRFHNDGEAWSAWEGYATAKPWTLRDAEGTRAVTVQFRDGAGNTKAYTDTIELDRVPPPLSLIRPVQGAALAANRLWVEGDAEPYAAILVHVAPSGVLTYTGLGEGAGFGLLLEGALRDGANTVTVTATDMAHNSAILVRQVTLDQDVPGVIDVAPTGATGQARPTLSGDFTEPVDPADVTLVLDGLDVTGEATVTAEGFAYTPAADLAAGAHSAWVQLRDPAGNVGDCAWSFGVDLDTWVEIQAPPLVNSSPIDVVVAGEVGAAVSLAVNGASLGEQTLAAGETTFAAVPLQAGGNTMAAAITDTLGHTAQDTAVVTLDLARPWPDVSADPVAFAPQGRLKTTQFALDGRPPEGEAIVGWRLAVISTSGSLVTATVGVHLPATVVWDGTGSSGQIAPGGAYSYTLVVTASNGSTAGTPAQVVWVLDGPPPAPQISTPQGDVVTMLSQMGIAGSAQPDSVVTLFDTYGYFTDTVPVDGDGRWSVERALFGGNNELYAVAENGFGAGPASNHVTVRLIPRPPLYPPVIVLPPTVRDGQAVTLRAAARGENPAEGRPTVAVSATVHTTQVSLAQVSGGITSMWEAQWTVAGLESGSYAVRFVGVDEEGYVGDGETALRVQSPPPAVRFGYPTVPVTRSTEVLVVTGWAQPLTTLRLYDNGALAATRRMGSVGDWSVTLTLAEGAHILTATASDDLAQVSPVATAGRVMVDTRPPTAALDPLPIYHTQPNVTLRWNGDDPTPGSGVVGYDVQHRVGAGNWQDYLSGVSYDEASGVFGEGLHGFRVRARDGAHNVGGYSSPVTTVVDLTDPALTLALNESDPHAHVAGSTVYYGPSVDPGSFTVTATAGDDTAGLEAIVFPETVSGGGTYPQGGAHQATVAHVYTFDASATFQGQATVEVTDRAGRESLAAFRVVRDGTAPVLALDAPVQGDVVLLSWSASDADSGLASCSLEVRENSGPWESVSTACSGSTAYADVRAGRVYTFRLRAGDRVGNEASTEASLTYQGVPPQASVEAAVQGDVVLLSWSATDADSGLESCTLAVQENGGSWQTVSTACSGSTTYGDVWAGREYTFRLRAGDRRGNEATDEASLTYQGVPPQVSVEAAVAEGGVLVTWSAFDAGVGLGGCELEVSADDGSWQTISTACAGSAAHGGPGHLYTFRLTAHDNVGNAESAEAQVGVPRVTKYYYHGGKRVAMRAAGVVYYLHTDHLGSTSLTTDASGAVVARQLYHPYGTVRYGEGTLPTNFGFTGQRHDSTGLIFMHARYYHPTLGRFASADTMVPGPANPQSFNRFAYVYNNPVRYTDPSGHCLPEECPNADLRQDKFGPIRVEVTEVEGAQRIVSRPIPPFGLREQILYSVPERSTLPPTKVYVIHLTDRENYKLESALANRGMPGSYAEHGAGEGVKVAVKKAIGNAALFIGQVVAEIEFTKASTFKHMYNALHDFNDANVASEADEPDIQPISFVIICPLVNADNSFLYAAAYVASPDGERMSEVIVFSNAYTDDLVKAIQVATGEWSIP